MMYRLLKDLINWKCNLYIKCKLGKLRYVRVASSSVFLCLYFLVCVDLVHCSSLSNNVEVEGGKKGRTLYEHGIFRHDKPWESTISSFPPRSDNSESNSNDHSSTTISPPDNRDRYHYDRFKRSVTTLNFHPKPKNHSTSSAGLKPLRIFKYVTEDDVLQPSGQAHSSEAHHQTIFRPFMKNESEHGGDIINHSTRVVGGAKFNLKAKLDKDDKSVNKSNKENDSNSKKSNQVISNRKNEANTQHQNDSTGDSEVKSSTSSSSSTQPKIIPSPSKPENILIFKPSLAIRKNANNKTSLIPSGKYGKLNNHLHYHHQTQMSNGLSNSITAAISTVKEKAQEQQKMEEEQHDEESTDPNSSTVNDRSLIHNYFDSVVVLNEEEGQKQLLRQGAFHREKTSNSDDVVDNVVGSGDADDDHHHHDGGVDDKIKNKMSEVHPPTSKSEPSSFSFTSALNPNSNADARKGKGRTVAVEKKNLIAEGKKIISPSLPIMRNSSNGDLIKSKMNRTSTGNRDRVIVKVVKKSRKSRQRQEGLVEDDGAQDGSERSRRSPFKQVPNRFQQQNGNRMAQINMHGPGEQLARAALFRRNTAIMLTPKMRQLMPHMTKKIAVAPRIIATGVSGPYARTLIPMKPIPMQPIPVMQVAKKSVGPHKLTFMPSGGGLLGPGPVGPPLSAIKVMPLIQNKNVFGQQQQPQITNPSAPPLPITPAKDLMTGASKTVYNFKPFPESVVLNHAASSYYSPTYERFQDRFQHQITNIQKSGKELEQEDADNTWEETRSPPRRHHRHHHGHNNHNHHQPRPRSRSTARHRHHHRPHHPRHDIHHRHHHSPHRSGAHSQHPHHHPTRPPMPRGKKLNPKYKYPKNAESIQDILSYFDKEAPPPPPHSRSRHEHMERTGPTDPKRQHSSLPSSSADNNPPGPRPQYTKLADLSGEFRDVHASLLKDIKEFAKRPNMFSSSSVHHDNRHSHSSHRDSMEGSGFFDPIDEIFNPQPKPVRDLIKNNHNNHDIKPDLYSLENIRERIALKRGKLGGRHKDKDQDEFKDEFKDEYKDEYKDGHSFQFDPPPHPESDDDFYDSITQPTQRPSIHPSRFSSAEHKKLYSSKEDYESPSKYTKKNRHSKQDNSDDSLYHSSHYKDSHSRSHSDPFEFSSAEYPRKSHISHSSHSTTRKPIVLKTPHEGYRTAKPKKSEYFWNTLAQTHPQTINLDSPLVLKSPQVQQAPTVLQPFSYSAFQNAAAAAHAMSKQPISEEEDIVEIHTGSPGPGIHAASGISNYGQDSHHLKQERLKKMYMDVLQQKLQLEAALLQPQAMPSTLQLPGMQMQTMHTSSSYLPQHNPHLLSRVSVAPQMPQYSPSTIVTHPPLTGMGGLAPRRKKPMRMKIHIYPNGNEGIEQGIEAANLLAAGGLGAFGASGFSASNPPPSVVPPPNSQDLHHKMSESAMPSGPTGPHQHQQHQQHHQQHPTSPSGYGGTGTAPIPQTVGSAVKNKNVVLHLHVHRRNDNSGGLELETEGSSPVPTAAMAPPKLTYKDIYNEQMKSEHQQHQQHLQNHRMAEEEEEEERSLLSNSSPQDQEGQESRNENHNHNHEQDEEEDVERDKSLSMEAPIHDDKIEDVFHTIMKLRKRPGSGATMVEDNRKKRNRN